MYLCIPLKLYFLIDNLNGSCYHEIRSIDTNTFKTITSLIDSITNVINDIEMTIPPSVGINKTNDVASTKKIFRI